MEIIPVRSSAIEKIGYADGSLFIKFRGNGWYIFRNVQEELFEKFRLAPSKGKFFNERIKPYFNGVPCVSLEQ